MEINLSKNWKKLNNFAQINDICNKLLVSNIPIWLLVKEDIFNYITGLKKQNNSSKNVFRILKNLNLSKRIQRIIESFNLKKRKKVDILFISSSQFRRGNNLSDFNNIYFDNIIKYLPKNLNYNIVEHPTYNFLDFLYDKSTNAEKVIPTDYWRLKIFIMKKLRVQNFKCIKKTINNFDYSMFSIDEKNYIKKSILKRYISYFYNSKILGKEISKIKPKLIIDIARGSIGCWPWAENIPIIDIQHGNIHKYHPGYSWSNYEKDNLRRIYKNKYLFCFSSDFKTFLTQYGMFPQKNIKVVSHPRLYNADFESRQKVLKRIGVKNNKRIILISSQDLEYYEEKVINFINNLYPLLTDEYQLIIKLHPREYDGSHPYDILENVKLVKEEVSLMNLLNTVDIHISCSSTVLREFMYFEKPNFILDNPMKVFFEDLIERDCIKIISSAEEFVNQLQNIDFIQNGNQNIELEDPFLFMKDYICELLEEESRNEN